MVTYPHLATGLLVERGAGSLRGAQPTLGSAFLVLLASTVPEVDMLAFFRHLGHLGQPFRRAWRRSTFATQADSFLPCEDESSVCGGDVASLLTCPFV